MCHGKSMDVRGQFRGVGSLFLPHGIEFRSSGWPGLAGHLLHFI